MQRATRDTFCDTLPLVEHIECTTWELKQSWSLQMWWSMMNYVQKFIQKTLPRFQKRLRRLMILFLMIMLGSIVIKNYNYWIIYIYFFVLSSSKPSTPVNETQQEESEPSSSFEQKGTSTSLVKGPSSSVKLNHLIINILGSLNDNMRLRSKALNLITHSC